jgi:hypothetical protein
LKKNNAWKNVKRLGKTLDLVDMMMPVDKLVLLQKLATVLSFFDFPLITPPPLPSFVFAFAVLLDSVPLFESVQSDSALKKFPGEKEKKKTDKR